MARRLTLTERLADWLTGGDLTTARRERDQATQRCAEYGVQLATLRRRLTKQHPTHCCEVVG